MIKRSSYRRFQLALENLLDNRSRREFPSRMTSPPKVAQIEVTSRCNLRCQMCPLADPYYEPSGGEAHLSLDRFMKILEKLPSLEAVSLQGLGEPLLNPELPAIVRAASDRGIHVTFFSNGMLLTEEKARALVESGLGHMVFSLDGGSAATYERIRRGAKFDKVLGNIRRMVEITRENASCRPELSIMIVGMKENLEEIPDIIRIASELGVPAVTIKNLYQDAGLPGSTASLGSGDVERLRVRIQSLALQNQVAVTMPKASLGGHEQERTCRWPWSAVYVKVHGEVSPCCYGIDYEFCNIFESSPDEVWNNRGIQKFRSELRRGCPSVCETCPDYSIVMESVSSHI